MDAWCAAPPRRSLRRATARSPPAARVDDGAAGAPAATSRGSRCRRRRAPAANSSTSTGCSARLARRRARRRTCRRRCCELTARHRRRRAAGAHQPDTRAPAGLRRRRAQPACCCARIAARLPGVHGRIHRRARRRSGLRRSDGLSPGWRAKRWRGRPGNLPAVTGARGPRVLGAMLSRLASPGSGFPGGRRRRCAGRVDRRADGWSGAAAARRGACATDQREARVVRDMLQRGDGRFQRVRLGIGEHRRRAALEALQACVITCSSVSAHVPAASFRRSA